MKVDSEDCANPSLSSFLVGELSCYHACHLNVTPPPFTVKPPLLPSHTYCTESNLCSMPVTTTTTTTTHHLFLLFDSKCVQLPSVSLCHQSSCCLSYSSSLLHLIEPPREGAKPQPDGQRENTALASHGMPHLFWYYLFTEGSFMRTTASGTSLDKSSPHLANNGANVTSLLNNGMV